MSVSYDLLQFWWHTCSNSQAMCDISQQHFCDEGRYMESLLKMLFLQNTVQVPKLCKHKRRILCLHKISIKFYLC